jgi:hypothetical protein
VDAGWVQPVRGAFQGLPPMRSISASLDSPCSSQN